MADILLQVDRKSLPGRLLSGAGLPLPTPLKRLKKGWPERPLEHKTVTVGGHGELHKTLAQILPAAGASIHALVGSAEADTYKEHGMGWARQVEELSGDYAHEKYRTDVLVYDATGLKTIAELDQVYEFLRLYVRRINRNGRVLLLARPAPAALTAIAPAAPETTQRAYGLQEATLSQALVGLSKSLAKETGGKGTTVNLLYIEAGAEDRLEGALRFLLSPTAAFITAQPLLVSKVTKHEVEEMPHSRVLEGRTVLLTGAARGIGAVTAEVLHREGAKLILLDRPEDRDALARVAVDTNAEMLLQDISAADAGDNIVRFIKEKYNGKLDSVIHNAGVTRDKTMGKMDQARWQQALNINLRCVVEITEKLVDSVLQPGGRILCTSSIAGIAGNFGQTNYGAAKAGLIGFVQAAAAPLAAKGIAINAVAPGFIETRMTEAIPFTTREAGRRLSALAQGGLPEDVGQAATFLSSDAANGITGQVLRICGGNFLGA